MKRSWYAESISRFCRTSDNDVLAELVKGSSFPILQAQRDAWLSQLPLLREALSGHMGKVYLEFEIPRMGHRVDAIALIDGLILAIEYKIDSREYSLNDLDQSYDYAMDLKYFHEASHGLPVVPILVASHAKSVSYELIEHHREAGLYKPIRANAQNFASIMARLVNELAGYPVDPELWETSRYCPTPTIVEAARALYAGHGVAEISRSDAEAINLSDTSEQLARIIEHSKSSGQKSICFVTGVPGAGKTLVGLNIATKYNDSKSDLHSVFLSGNGPLVAILREALARDTVRRERACGNKLKKNESMTRVKAFIQNVHHFRDECLRDSRRPPVDHVALFDEAQRAWDLEQTASFMSRKKRVSGFNISEPEFLISCMNRRDDWAVIVCLVGGGQEINTGEAGIGEWIAALQKKAYEGWHLYISPALTDSEYGAGAVLSSIQNRDHVHYQKDLHLAVSMRSFRSEKVSGFVKSLLDCEKYRAQDTLQELENRYPIVLTRDSCHYPQFF